MFSMRAEQSVLGCLLNLNSALDKITDLKTDEFYHADHRKIFDEIVKQINAGKVCDVITVYDGLGDAIDDGLVYLNLLAVSTFSAASIRSHANIVIEFAKKRKLTAICREAIDEIPVRPVPEISNHVANELERLSQGAAGKDPKRFSDSLTSYVELLQARVDGSIKPISTGFLDLDLRLDGGFERGTLNVLAARPSMGKTAFGLAMARNVAEWGSVGFLSMEMPFSQVNDRNVAAMARVPISWLRKPNDADEENWTRLTAAFAKADEMKLWIDDETSLNISAIRSKARYIKRRSGLDLLIIDQLSFITGSNAENKSYEIGEYTRGLLALAKELDCVVLLLAQLNRDCEKRNNKRPMLSDLSSSGSIEQDASTVIMLYRDEIYNPDTPDKGICEVITVKQRQGEPGITPLTYIGNQTRFESVAFKWQSPAMREEARSNGFD
jgi:replicative DNA helicase